MTDNNNDAPQDEGSKTLTPEEWKAKEETLRSGFAVQAKELKDQIAQLAKANESTKAEADMAERERLAKNEEYKTLAEQLEEQVKTTKSKYESEVANLQAQINSMNQDAAITKAGISDEFAILGIKTKYSLLDSPPPMEEWLETLKEEKPELFAEPAPEKVQGKNNPAGVVSPIRAVTDTQIDKVYANSPRGSEERKQTNAAVLKELGLENKRF